MGQITKVHYETNKNLGNYETESVHLEADVNPNEDAMEVLDQLQELAVNYLGLEKPEKDSSPKKSPI